MTVQEINSSVDEIVALALSGKSSEVWDKFYHPDVEKIDLDGVTIMGKAAVIKANHSLLENITEVRSYSHGGSLIIGNRSFIVWDVDFDVKELGTIKTTEVCIQDWQDGKIVKERFFS